MASLAQDESRKMSERTKAGIQTSQKKGTYVAGPTPFGISVIKRLIRLWCRKVRQRLSEKFLLGMLMAYDDDPISRQPSSRLAADLPASITIKLNYEQARAYRNSRGYVLWPGNWKDLTVKVLL